PSRPAELAVLEVAQRVGREEAVGLEELAQDGPVADRLDGQRAAGPAAGDRDAGHQAMAPSGSAGRANGGVRGPVAVSHVVTSPAGVTSWVGTRVSVPGGARITFSMRSSSSASR